MQQPGDALCDSARRRMDSSSSMSRSILARTYDPDDDFEPDVERDSSPMANVDSRVPLSSSNGTKRTAIKIHKDTQQQCVDWQRLSR